MKVNKGSLLILACLVWSAAGANIFRIGAEAYSRHLSPMNLLLSAAVFGVFYFFIFGRLVKKHTRRILSYTQPQWFFRFFDGKSFAIMAVMMSGGIWLRSSGVAPDRFIALFYSGLGGALLLSGISFGIHFVKYRVDNGKETKLCKQ